MGAVHDVAAVGFGGGAAVYDRSRPTYPGEAVTFLADALRIGAGRVVCDLAAGTGIFTRLLVPFDATVIACEPVAGMRARLRANLPGLPVVAGTAERLPFTAASLDAITVAQAFHWFDTDRALAEVHRVLRPGGRLGMLWNARDRSVAWVDAVWSVMDAVEKRAPWRDHDRTARDPHAWREEALRSRAGFEPLHAATFHHRQHLSPDGVVERILGVSHVQVLPDRERAAVLDEVRSILATHPESAGRATLSIPYRVDCYWTERTP
jgi:SAM-dependent methyltransferase